MFIIEPFPAKLKFVGWPAATACEKL